MEFPVSRPRRLRRNAAIRDMVRETRLSVKNLIYPMFVDETAEAPVEVKSMSGVFRLPLSQVAEEAKAVAGLGIPAVILFGVPAEKDDSGSRGYAADGIVQRAIPEIKAAAPGLQVIADVCNCEYTSHGHCGLMAETPEGVMDVENDATLELLATVALSMAASGADLVAPSDMMDGRVGVLRDALDDGGYDYVGMMAYSAKYASAFYGPFRDAADSAPQTGDRKTYQMDPANAREALREVMLDVNEGADIVMVKPALSYLDVIRAVRETVELPVAAYNVSGEYAMVKAAARQGWVDERQIVMEILTSIKRAGADLILTYHAKDAAGWLGA